jgi:hypothetical protein
MTFILKIVVYAIVTILIIISGIVLITDLRHDNKKRRKKTAVGKNSKNITRN